MGSKCFLIPRLSYNRQVERTANGVYESIQVFARNQRYSDIKELSEFGAKRFRSAGMQSTPAKQFNAMNSQRK
ncbi:hypothetical protein Xlen_10375 [Xanthomonas campestris pv. leeana]|nr:hypothetical protein WS7_01790 [Xanthomonas citri pv. malvacearum str. GSPB2388]OOW59763.1 hypothetical protein Xcnt_03525 [Xanthomonas campestris pv. centellae]OOW64474.1 hypothetical protein Xths_01845 [Xanthomonas campestris pv. thespesiae]OOW81169.1 hypothetical protein Xlen_10375 [Xanthomonas campestris pv. leeana]